MISSSQISVCINLFSSRGGKFFSISSDFWRNWGNWRDLKSKRGRTWWRQRIKNPDGARIPPISRRPVRFYTPAAKMWRRCSPGGHGMNLSFQVDADEIFSTFGSIHVFYFPGVCHESINIIKHLQKETYKFYTKKGSNLNSRVENHVASKTIGGNLFVSLENWWIFRFLISRHMFCSFAGKNMSHLWKGKIIFQATFQGDMWLFPGGYAVMRMLIVWRWYALVALGGSWKAHCNWKEDESTTIASMAYENAEIPIAQVVFVYKERIIIGWGGRIQTTFKQKSCNKNTCCLFTLKNAQKNRKKNNTIPLCCKKKGHCFPSPGPLCV